MFIPFFTNKNIQLLRMLVVSVFVLMFSTGTYAQRASAIGAGQRAIVIDERLAVLRESPSLYSPLLKRLSRGRLVTVMSTRRSPEGVTFYRVAVTRRTRGWLQSEAVVSRNRKRDDERLFNLIKVSKDFDRIVRASIFLKTFPNSIFRPAVLLLLGMAAEDAARKLSGEATRRLDEVEMNANRASILSYFMNYVGIDRYKRQGIDFVFDEVSKQYHYGGASWREIIRRYPRSDEAVEARQRLASLEVGDK